MDAADDLGCHIFFCKAFGKVLFDKLKSLLQDFGGEFLGFLQKFDLLKILDLAQPQDPIAEKFYLEAGKKPAGIKIILNLQIIFLQKKIFDLAWQDFLDILPIIKIPALDDESTGRIFCQSTALGLGFVHRRGDQKNIFLSQEYCYRFFLLM